MAGIPATAQGGLFLAATLQSPFFEVTHGAVRSWQRICHVGLGQKIWKMLIHLATWQTWQTWLWWNLWWFWITGSLWKNSSNFRRFWNWLGSKVVDFAYAFFRMWCWHCSLLWFCCLYDIVSDSVTISHMISEIPSLAGTITDLLLRRKMLGVWSRNLA